MCGDLRSGRVGGSAIATRGLAKPPCAGQQGVQKIGRPKPQRRLQQGVQKICHPERRVRAFAFPPLLSRRADAQSKDLLLAGSRTLHADSRSLHAG
jgi:hypothetical protein